MTAHPSAGPPHGRRAGPSTESRICVVTRIAVAADVLNQIQSMIDERRNEGGARSAAVELIDVAGEEVATAEAALRWGLDASAFDAFLARAPRLRWLHSPGAGVEGWPLAEIAERGITLTNAAGVYAIPIAEWVLATMLEIVKRLDEVRAAQRERRWVSDLGVGELYGKTILLLGSGGISQQVIVRAAAFGMRILVANRSGRPVELAERTVTDDWRQLLGEADFVVSTLPLTTETAALIGATEVAQLKPTAWVINVGRGGTIDQEALFAALEDRRIAGAALDVFTTEPLPPESPAWALDNLIISPHMSGDSEASQRRSLELFADNVIRFAANEPLLNVVDLTAGY
jgi:phosphoglycerate dehydrogenase-like enzyme